MRHSRKILAIMTALGLLLSLGACGSSGKNNAQPSDSSSKKPDKTKPIVVVSTTNEWGSLAGQIGGDDVSVSSILNSTSISPRDFKPTSADKTHLHNAAVVITNGAGYDTWVEQEVGKKTVTVSAAGTVGASKGDDPHLWFSKDARKAVASEMADTFSRVLPSRKKSFSNRLEAWQKQESKLEAKLKKFAATHKKDSYAATSSVANYLMSDLGFENLTPKNYQQSTQSGQSTDKAELQEFQRLIESRSIMLLISNSQDSNDATNALTGTAGRSSIPVVPVSEQIPDTSENLSIWIEQLMRSINEAIEQRKGADSADASKGGLSDQGSPNDDSQDSSNTPSNEGQGDPQK